MEPVTVIAFANIVTGISYLGLGIYIAPRFDIGAGWRRDLIRLLAVMLYLLASGNRFFYAHWHLFHPASDLTWYIAISQLVQGFVGLLLLGGMLQYLRLRIYVNGKADEEKPWRWKDFWPNVRDATIFFGGLGLALWEALHEPEPDILVLGLAGGMMGVPIVWRANSVSKREP